MNISILQQAKTKLSAEAYEYGKLIAVVRNDENPQFVTYIEIELQQSQKHDYYVFLITQVLQFGDLAKQSVIQQKRTTHYHKAIGIAVSINS